MTLANFLTAERINELSLPSNYKYGEAIYRRKAVEIINQNKSSAEAWVGGLAGAVIEGGGSRRRTTITLEDGKLRWHCTGNPMQHQIFCKHCVALALAILYDSQK